MRNLFPELFDSAWFQPDREWKQNRNIDRRRHGRQYPCQSVSQCCATCVAQNAWIKSMAKKTRERERSRPVDGCGDFVASCPVYRLECVVDGQVQPATAICNYPFRQRKSGNDDDRCHVEPVATSSTFTSSQMRVCDRGRRPGRSFLLPSSPRLLAAPGRLRLPALFRLQ